MLDKTYKFSDFEGVFYEQSKKYFKSGVKPGKPYTIMMPPPNITGSLHLGHALTYTLQDILIRYKRMDGYDCLWQPGTDHAGIAAQMVVERQLAKDGIHRHDLGRDQFIEKIWEWKQVSGDTIVNQQQRLGISPDWDRARFTMDAGLSKAVVKVFVDLHDKGLIYRDKRLVNWDVKLQTAISDIEVENRDENGHLWYMRYPIENSDESIVVATTRPETLFGDVCVAVHPDDDRYTRLVGKFVKIPLSGRVIPIVTDEYCDMEKGSGAVKITPAHDFNDFDVGRRHDFAPINIMDENCCLNEHVPEKYQGLSTHDARKMVLDDLDAGGFLEKTETIHHSVPYGDRSGVVIQPLLMDQWFVDAKTLAGPAIDAVRDGRTTFVPENWSNTYFEWLNNIQPWCISRQIWWGHQIPAWFADDGTIFVAESEDVALKKARIHFNKDVNLRRDTDVLDTWFSSALWPFTTLGWPDDDTLQNRYYPTDVLITGFDIVFFWVARMMMMGLHYMGDVPFKTVYMHALVRDEKGQKMSKSKGNVTDPLDMVNTYGCDALRFTLAHLSTPGRDIRMGESRVENNRNFITKIWNAARFLEMNNCHTAHGFDPQNAKSYLSQWLVSQVNTLIKDVRDNLDTYRFDLTSHTLYQFLWGQYCDVFLESLKPMLQDTIPQDIQDDCRKAGLWAFLEFLKLLHPIMPMVTEKLFHELAEDPNHDPLIVTDFPVANLPVYGGANNGMDFAHAIVSEIRSLKGLLNVTPGLKLKSIVSGDSSIFDMVEPVTNIIKHLGRLETFEYHSNQIPKGIQCVVRGLTIHLDMGADFDFEGAKSVLEVKLQSLESDCTKLSKKLSNEAFKTAKPDLYAADHDAHNQKSADMNKLKSILTSWG